MVRSLCSSNALDHSPAISLTHRRLSGTFGGIIEAVGYDVLRDRPSGRRDRISSYTGASSRKPDQKDYGTSDYVIGAWGAEWDNGEEALYPSDQWIAGRDHCRAPSACKLRWNAAGSHYTSKLAWGLLRRPAVTETWTRQSVRWDGGDGPGRSR